MVRFGSKRIKKSRQLSVESQEGATAQSTGTLTRPKHERTRSKEIEPDFLDDDVILDDYPFIEDNDFPG